MSRKQGVMLVGIADEFKDELELIEQDIEKKSQSEKHPVQPQPNKE